MPKLKGDTGQLTDSAPSLVDVVIGRMGAQRARLRQALGGRAAETMEFVLFAGVAMPWIAMGLRPDDAPWFGLTLAPLLVAGWILLTLRGDDGEAAAMARNRLLLGLCLAACLAGSLACVIAFAPKKASANEWTPPRGTLETQIGEKIPAPSPPTLRSPPAQNALPAK